MKTKRNINIIVSNILKNINKKIVSSEELEGIEEAVEYMVKTNTCFINPDGYYLQCGYCGADITHPFLDKLHNYNIKISKELEELRIKYDESKIKYAELEKEYEALKMEQNALWEDYMQVCDDNADIFDYIEKLRSVLNEMKTDIDAIAKNSTV